MERVQRGLIGTRAAACGRVPGFRRAALAGRALLVAGVALSLAACNTTDTKVRVGGGVQVTYAVTSTSGVLD